MAPIYDTDIAEERWSRAEWNQYELWERVELRLRRRKQLWILATAAAVFGLFSVPIVADQKPKWETLRAARILANELNWMKREAGTRLQSFRMVFPENGTRYRIERVRSCQTGPTEKPGDAPVTVREAPLGASGTEMAVIGSEESTRLELTGLVREFCYDPLLGSEATASATAGIGIIPVRDIGSDRTDRVSVLLISGPSADISFD